MMKKILFWSASLIILAGLAFLILTPKQLKPIEIKPADLEPINIVLVGDMMFDRGVAYMIEKKGNSDFRFPFLKIADELNEADIVFGNLEGPVSDKGTKVGSIYSFRMDPKTIDALNFAHINVVSLANNHALDYGREALEDSLNRLKAAGIAYAGAGFNEKKAFSPAVIEVNGSAGSPQVKIGFLAYTNLGPKTWRANGENSGVAWIDRDSFESVKQQIQEARKDSDILIVSLHAGEEYEEPPTQFQIDFNKMAQKAGADIIVHHHPHIIQQGLYSLGNFIFDQGFSEETMKSKIIELKVRDQKIKEVIEKDIEINNFFQPILRP